MANIGLVKLRFCERLRKEYRTRSKIWRHSARLRQSGVCIESIVQQATPCGLVFGALGCTHRSLGLSPETILPSRHRRLLLCTFRRRNTQPTRPEERSPDRQRRTSFGVPKKPRVGHLCRWTGPSAAWGGGTPMTPRGP